jgi:formylglycine-generating enzyme
MFLAVCMAESLLAIALFSADSALPTDVFKMGSALTNLEFVTVGDPGNPADSRYKYLHGPGPSGAVDHVYRIGKYEVTNAQYIVFLNKVAATDQYGLYNEQMGAGGFSSGGIAKTGDSGAYKYGPRDGDRNWLNRPVVLVSYWDACRFVNWLHNGQPSGPQTAATTEDGAYALDGYTGEDGRKIVRKPGAKYFIPNDNEWYKAAYYKGGNTNAGYWTYPTRSDSEPVADMPPGRTEPPGSADYADVRYEVTPVGAYTRSPGPYGTFDQCGNVSEWTETVIFDPSDTMKAVSRGDYMVKAWTGEPPDAHPRHVARGGSWQGGIFSPNGFGASKPHDEHISMGFRVAAVP